MISDPQRAFRDLVRNLEPIPLRFHREEIEATYQFVMDYIEHNEWGLGLEILCDNLHEYDFPLPRSIFEQIAGLGNAWGIDTHRIEILRELIRD